MILLFFFQNTKIDALIPKIIDFKNLDDSVVIFQALKTFACLCSLINLSSLCSLSGLNSLYSPIFSKNFLVLMIRSSLAPKWPILVIFGRMHQIKFFTNLSIRGCWGQPMLLFWKLVDGTQMPKPQKFTDTYLHYNLSVISSWRPRSLKYVKASSNTL